MNNQLTKKSINTRNLICSLILVIICIAITAYLDINKYEYSYTISIIQRSLIFAVVACSMNLLTGFTGLFSLGQAGFMALGAYTTSILTIPLAKRPGVYYVHGIYDVLAKIYIPWPIALILGGIVAAVFAAIIGFPVLRLKSDYLAIATLGFSEIIRAIIAAPMMDKITNGSYGLKNIPGFTNLFQIVIISAICITLMILLINSSYGRDFKAIHEDEIAAEAMGINLFKTKQISFITSSFFTGIAGGMLAMYMRSIDTKTFMVSLTYDILLIVVLGGIGSMTGSIIGSFLITAGKEYLRYFDEPMSIAGVEITLFRPGFRMVVFSVFLMIVVLFFRKGIMGGNEFSWNKIFDFLYKITHKKVSSTLNNDKGENHE